MHSLLKMDKRFDVDLEGVPPLKAYLRIEEMQVAQILV